MIKLFREEHSPQADTIEAEFRDMVLGYDRVIINSSQSAQLFGGETILPVITNNDLVVSGDAIPAYIKALTRFMHQWQLFQGDTCYVKDNGETC